MDQNSCIYVKEFVDSKNSFGSYFIPDYGLSDYGTVLSEPGNETDDSGISSLRLVRTVARNRNVKNVKLGVAKCDSKKKVYCV